ncbi:acyltransferase, putative, partial [Bodo saltans]
MLPSSWFQVVVVALVLAQAAHRGCAQPSPTTTGQIPLDGLCTQSTNQLQMTGTFDKIALAIEYGAVLMIHDLGSYDLCSMAPNSHYCTTYFGLMCVREDGSEEVIQSGNACTPGPVIGMCVPQECSGSMLSNQVQNFTRQSLAFQIAFGFHSKCIAPVPPLPTYCTDQSYGFMSADCLDEKKSFTSDSSALAVFAVIVVLCGLSIACAAAGIYRRWSQASAASGGDEAGRLLPKGSSSGCKEVNVTVQGDEEVAPQSKLWEAVSWFDIVENARDFFTVKARNVGSVDTRFFEGVRTIAMLFVLFGHSLFFPSLFNYYNATIPVAYLESYASIGVFPAELAVDTFFYLSGFLMFHLYLKYSEKRAVNGELQHPPISHIPMMYLR